jgi:ABC-2 type transport system permease protein
MWNALGLEWFKLRKRLATWGIYLIFLTLSIFLFGSIFYSARGHGGPYWGLPDAWPDILTLGSPLASVFTAVLVALVVSSDFEWKTSRQNVMDGLSKGNWFTAKLLLLPALCLAMYGTQILLGGTLAFFDTHSAHRIVHYYQTSAYLIAGVGVLLAMCFYSAIAMLISIAVRSSGPAIGLTLIYGVLDNIVAHTLQGFHLDAIAAWLPFQVHMALLDFQQYLPHTISASGYHWNTWTLLLAGLGWTGAVAVAAHRIYFSRDL